MKALSIKQPWLWAIICAGKNVENRSWKTKYRGWIALHASAKPVPLGDFEMPRGVHCPDLKSLDFSAICGIARLVDIRTSIRSKWFYRPGRGQVSYGWVLEDVIQLKRPIACTGSLGVWTVSPRVRRAIQRQLPRVTFDD